MWFGSLSLILGFLSSQLCNIISDIIFLGNIDLEIKVLFCGSQDLSHLIQLSSFQCLTEPEDSRWKKLSLITELNAFSPPVKFEVGIKLIDLSVSKILVTAVCQLGYLCVCIFI